MENQEIIDALIYESARKLPNTNEMNIIMDHKLENIIMIRNN